MRDCLEEVRNVSADVPVADFLEEGLEWWEEHVLDCVWV